MNLPEQVKVYGGSNNRVNSVIVVGDRGTVVVDTHVTLEDGRAVKQMAEELSGRKPVLAVALTHEHFDHIAGNQFFDCGIVSSRACRDEILASRAGLNTRVPGLVVTAPNVAFETELLFSLDDLNLRMRHEGGHCKGESSIFIPEISTLLTGDLVFVGRPPFVASADIPQWITALTRLYGMDPEVVIPGHGEPGNKSILLTQRAWLETFMETTLACKRKSMSRDEACTNVMTTLGLPSERREVLDRKSVV